METKIGVITYHSAYNFGSVLQAYATQESIEKIGYSVEIVNYRMKSQIKYYSMIHLNNGLKAFLKDLLHLPQIGKYITRKNRFEQFIEELNLTKEFNEPEEVDEADGMFDIFVSGSDQIWNKHSNELEESEWKYMYPYLLCFTNKKKVSYASSIVNMKDEELTYIVDKVKKFDKISFREKASCDRFKSLFGIESNEVLDPTLLLNSEEWSSKIGTIPEKMINKKYILYYALEGVKKTRKIMPKLQKMAKRKGCVLVVITPLSCFTYSKGVINAIDAGPKEFLGWIKGAELVITNSYHGTLFSVNLGTNFYTLQEKESTDNRIKGILLKLELEKRIISDVDSILYEKEEINFQDVWKKLDIYRKESIEFLKKALKYE
ncbi:polysaccharide pyruvyl transferase family protein [Eubacterium sp. LMAG:50]|uniref:polysaccharide pyruvyl transferase family protein n=1 Tax=Eubacterium sp. LMAG:50 TaxID=1969563 RepID=UPI0025BF0E26|nr:polysaccharide pyruvyl transferase family protein [Eubacterium sp. LMAG:50]